MPKFRETFHRPNYEDAPHLSDQLLLPNLASGHDIHLLSAFAPSYIFKLLRDLASSPELEEGFLNLVFFIPGDLTTKSGGIARVRKYFLQYGISNIEVANFIDDCLQVISEGGLRISFLHTKQKSPLARGAIGVIKSNEDQEDFVAFVDAKGGDYNSPVKPLRSWVDDDFFESQEILAKVIQASSGQHPKGALVAGTEAEEWLVHIADWYKNNSTEESDKEDDADEPDEGDELDEFLLHLLETDGLDDDEVFGWDEEDDSHYEWQSSLAGYFVEVKRGEAINGHVPPLPETAAAFIGPASAICACGHKFVRVYGCDRVTWD